MVVGPAVSEMKTLQPGWIRFACLRAGVGAAIAVGAGSS